MFALCNADWDSSPPTRLPPRVEEDARTTEFLGTLDEAVLVAYRKELAPLARTWMTNFSHVGPVEFRNQVYVLKEPAVSVYPHLLLLLRL